MRIREADPSEAAPLARLLWRDTLDEWPSRRRIEEFTAALASWWAAHQDSHRAFVADSPEHGIVGMAWVAFVPRIPRPGTVNRLSADIQTVYVEPDHRAGGLGSALVEAATSYATDAGAARVTVHSGRRAVTMYQRLGFASSEQLLQRVR